MPTKRTVPIVIPSAMPPTTARPKPVARTNKVWLNCRNSSPLWIVSQKATAIAEGGGRNSGVMTVRQAISQIASTMP